MPKTESIMLFYREAFLCLISLRVEFISGNNGSLLTNEKWARVPVNYKRLVISYMRSLLLLPSSQEQLFSYSALRRICFFEASALSLFRLVLFPEFLYFDLFCP